ncbi:MAG: sialate O-acetylesterase, partial [Bacteroidota bacterium]|nr:sialate O-acetylesterase [Bacteroidota bacterium]
IGALCQGSDTIRVYYLGGQSNMDGFGFNKDLPGPLSHVSEDVWIFHGNPVGDDLPEGGLGLWQALQPGHGTGFQSDGHKNEYSNRFGVELSLARRLQELYPGNRIALIKYSRGGTSIDSLATGPFGCWEPDYQGSTGINQYDHFLRTVRTAMNTADIDGDGSKDVLVPAGIVWMQGESDASYTEEIANRYYFNLKRLMDLIRASFRCDDLAVVIGKISDSWDDPGDGKVWDHGELVQYAQEKFARNDGNSAIVRETRYYKYSDTWHYDSEGYLDLGKKFAEALKQLDIK